MQLRALRLGPVWWNEAKPKPRKCLVLLFWALQYPSLRARNRAQ